MLDGLTTDVILGMDFLKRYNPIVSWLDWRVGMPCLAQMVVAVNQAQIL